MTPAAAAAARALPERYVGDDLWQQVSYLAYHLHWSLDALLDLEHGDRLRLLRQVGALNSRAAGGQ